MSALFKKDTLSGIFITIVAAFFLVQGMNLQIGTFAEMGPGFVPISLSIILLFIGATLIFNSLRASNQPKTTIQISKGTIRASSLIVLSVLLFTILLYPLGYLISCMLLVGISSFASPSVKPREAIISSIVLSIVSAICFINLLGLPMPMWPEIFK